MNKDQIDQIVEQRFNELKEHFDKEGVEWMPFGPVVERQRIRNEVEAELGPETVVEKIRRTRRNYQKR